MLGQGREAGARLSGTLEEREQGEGQCLLLTQHDPDVRRAWHSGPHGYGEGGLNHVLDSAVPCTAGCVPVPIVWPS